MVESMQKRVETRYADGAGMREWAHESRLRICGAPKALSAASVEAFRLHVQVEIEAENSENWSFSTLTMVTADERGGS